MDAELYTDFFNVISQKLEEKELNVTGLRC
jgi:hypothetical protein